MHAFIFHTFLLHQMQSADLQSHPRYLQRAMNLSPLSERCASICCRVLERLLGLNRLISLLQSVSQVLTCWRFVPCIDMSSNVQARCGSAWAAWVPRPRV